MSHNSSTGDSAFLDSRETAPAAATETMFDVDPQLSQDGGLAIATLGELKGLYQLHQSSGSLAWGMLVAPAALLAREWTLSAHAGDVLQQMAPVLLHDARFAELASSYVVEQVRLRGYLSMQLLFCFLLYGALDSSDDLLSHPIILPAQLTSITLIFSLF